jgi:hypothetical protein
MLIAFGTPFEFLIWRRAGASTAVMMHGEPLQPTVLGLQFARRLVG